MKLSEYEDAIIGAAWKGGPTVAGSLAAELAPDRFSEQRPSVYKAVLDCWSEHGRVDILLVAKKLGPKLDAAGGMDNLRYYSRALELLGIESMEGLPQWAKVVDNAGRLRQMKSVAEQNIRELDDIEDAVVRIDNVDQYLADTIAKVQRVSAGMEDSGYRDIGSLVELWETNVQGGGMTEFVPSGFPRWDETILGLPVGLTIICGLPSIGKTQLALEIGYRRARALAKAGRKGTVLFNSIEMSSTKLVTRMACSLAGVDSRRLRMGVLDDVENARLHAAKLLLRGLPFLVDDSDYVTSAMLKMKAMAYSNREDTSMMITDFAELVADAGVDDETREQQVSGIYRSQRSVSRNLSIPVVLLAQYNRTPMSRDDKLGYNSDIRYSGMAEIAADQIIHIYSPWQLTRMQVPVIQPPRDMPVIDNVAYIVCGKNRDGPVGFFRLRWQPRWTRWSDLSEPADDFAQIVDDGDF